MDAAMNGTRLPVVVDDAAFAYLKIQQGGISSLAHDRGAWLQAYKMNLQSTYHGMRPYLPVEPAPGRRLLRCLDVGSGLGGIHILLDRHYGGDYHALLLDGTFDQPELRLHRETFSNEGVARAFLAENGVGAVGTIAAIPDLLGHYRRSGQQPPECDLIVSLQSWCFHYEPGLYLKFVKACCAENATLILDVRRNKPEWSRALLGAFELVAVLHLSDKFDRVVFRAR